MPVAFGATTTANAIQVRFPDHVGETEYPLSSAVQVKKPDYSGFVDQFPGESGREAWLRYAALPDAIKAHSERYSAIVSFCADKSSPVHQAANELQKGIKSILGQDLAISSDITSVSQLPPNSIFVGTLESFTSAGGSAPDAELKEDGFWLSTKECSVIIAGQNERGALYGAFEFLSMIAKGNFEKLERTSSPCSSIRWANQWDNLDGTIERGYSGQSIFFADGEVIDDLTRVSEYGRLLASVGLNGLIVNNVNTSALLLSEKNLRGLGRIANVLRPWGVRIGISAYFDSPKTLGGLTTADPLNEDVVKWWNDKTTEIYQHIPDFCGYTVKASAEGQPGPLSYGRTLSDAANMFARALQPHGDGCVLYRAFMYDDRLDENDWKNDRANAAVDFFKDLDGQFDDNVIVQVKFGPIDFQVREPAHPLFANLKKTNLAIEFQVVQEYNGQQSHVYYMPPLWKTILDFDLRLDGQQTLVRDILSGKRGNCTRTGFVSVVNVGSDSTWLCSHLAMANLYAFGRYAWDPSLDDVSVAEDWTRLTFGLNQKVVDVTSNILMQSFTTYENYTGNLGIQTLSDLTYTHFGPWPNAHDGNCWGQWTRATKTHIGMDRTVATGSGNAGYYPPEAAKIFENIESTPDELLLWFHHVPYTHKLKSGKSVIQHFYDAHYDGAATVQEFVKQWETLKGLIDEKRFQHVLFKLKYQAGHALVWRDCITNFYHKKCGIEDEKNRVNNYKYRIEAEDMVLDGYEVVDVPRSEMASGGKAIVTSSMEPGSAQVRLEKDDGIYDIAVNYFDHMGGKSQYQLLLNDNLIGEWVADLEDKMGHDFSEHLDGHSATRIMFPAVKVQKGDILKLFGRPDGSERAPVDYVSVLPEGVVD